MGEQKQQQRGNTSVAPPTPWSSIMAWRTLMAMVMAALLATSSCLAQDALPDLPDVPEMPAIGTTSESLYSMGRRSLQQYPAVVRGQEPGGGRHELLHEPVARLC